MTKAEIVKTIGPEGIRKLRELLDKELTCDFTDEYIEWAESHGAVWVETGDMFRLLAPGEHAHLQVIDFDSELVEWIHGQAVTAPFPENLRTYTFFRFYDNLADRELNKYDALFMYMQEEQLHPSPLTEPDEIHFNCSSDGQFSQLSRYGLIMTWLHE